MNGRPGGKIVGVGRALASRVVTNRDLKATLDTTEDWISSRTGISERRFVGEDEDCATLAIGASKKALEHAGASGDSGFVDHILGADGKGAPLGRAGQPGDPNKLYQNGREVFKFAVRILPEMFEKLLSRNGLTPDDVQFVIPHQANARIIRSAAKKMDIPEERIVINLDRFGNTSAASIPLSYPDIYDKMERGKYVVTVGFGFGLTWAANLYRI